MLSTNLKRSALALILATASGFSALAQEEAGNQVTVQAEAQSGGAAFGVIRTAPGPNVMQWSSNFQTPAPYWIGVEGQPLDAAMRTALDLPEKQGILVARVTDKSPAAKAGLQSGDILLQWCDADKKCQPLESVEHLVKLVQDTAAKQPDQTITLEYRRRGKTDTVELKPAKREQAGQSFAFKSENIGPNEYAQHQLSAMQQHLKILEKQRDEVKEKVQQGLKQVGDTEGKALKSARANLAKDEAQLMQLEAQVRQTAAQLQQFELWSKTMSKHGFSIANPNNPQFDVLIPAPGLVTNTISQDYINIIKPSAWPENLSVTMKRKGNKPAEFVVQRGEEQWEVTAENLKDLPQDIRAIVEPMAEPQKSRMLRLWSAQGNDLPGRVELRVPEGERPPMPGLPIAPPRVVIHATPQVQPLPALAPQATQKQLDDLQKAVEQLRKQIELMERK